MSLTIKRLLPTVILPMALLAGAGALHHKNTDAKPAVTEGSAGAVPAFAETLDRDAALVPKNRPDLTVFSARSPGESQTRVFVQSIGRDAPRLVYVDAEPGQLVDVSADGNQGVFRRFVSPGKSVDVAVDFRKQQT